LIDFERSLNRVEPTAIINTKYLLGDLYIKLKQMGNAKRILNWLSEHAPNSPEVSKLRLSLTNPVEQKRITDAKLFAERKKKLSQTYWLQECELDKLWLGQEGIDCQEGRLSNH
jgi:predicted Zn-dependent protease